MDTPPKTDAALRDEAFLEDEAGGHASSLFLKEPGGARGLRPPGNRLPGFAPFVAVAAVLVAVWAFLFFTAPKDMKPQHLHVCETQGPDSQRTLCLH